MALAILLGALAPAAPQLAPAAAQEAPRPPPKDPPLPPVPPPAASPSVPPPAAAPDATTSPPYEPELERLAELMGTLAYLRDLCGKGDGAAWRARMAALLDAEARTPERRERLAGAFNRGFRDYRVTYRTCTASAEVVIGRFLDEGDRLTRELNAHYGGT